MSYGSYKDQRQRREASAARNNHEKASGQMARNDKFAAVFALVVVRLFGIVFLTLVIWAYTHQPH
jgi:hypothetical protein